MITNSDNESDTKEDIAKISFREKSKFLLGEKNNSEKLSLNF